MTSRQLILFLAIALPATHAVFATNGCPGEIAPVRYHPSGAFRIEISITIDGSGPYTFLVDTGSQITILEPSLAAELNLKPEGSMPILFGVRPGRVGLFRPDSVALGPYSVGHPLIAVQGLAQLQVSNPKLRGILGEDFLAHYDLLIDRGRKILCLDQTGSMQQKIAGEHIPMLPSPDLPDDPDLPSPILIPVHLAESGARNTSLILDSGASTALFFSHRLGTASSIYQPKQARVAGAAAQSFFTLPPQDLHIGKHLLRDVVFVTAINNTGAQAPDGEDGLLPTTLFDRVFISHAGHFVISSTRADHRSGRLKSSCTASRG